MLSHLSAHMVTEDLAINTESLTTHATIEFKLNVFVLVALAELLWLL